MTRRSLVAIIVFALLIVGIVVYLARPRTDETENVRLHEAPAPTQPVTAPSSASPSLVSCTGPASSQVPIATLDSRHQWAHSLLVANHVDASLTELRNIATIDPGYPAINLEISEALLKSKHATDAKDAIKLQVEISQCLANLPPAGMQEYCKSEWVSEPQGGCASELARISRQAHDESVRVDAEVARAVEPRPVPAPIPTAVAPQRKAVAPPPTVSPAAVTASVAPESTVVKNPAPAPAAPPSAPPINLRSTEASDHVGEVARVCGEVVSKHTADGSSGKPTFINLDRAFPSQTFTVVVWDKDASAVGELPESGNLCVTGTVLMYRGTPEIVIADAKSWSK